MHVPFVVESSSRLGLVRGLMLEMFSLSAWETLNIVSWCRLDEPQSLAKIKETPDLVSSGKNKNTSTPSSKRRAPSYKQAKLSKLFISFSFSSSHSISHTQPTAYAKHEKPKAKSQNPKPETKTIFNAPNS